MTLTDDIKARIAEGCAPKRELGEWVIEQLSARGAKAGAASKGRKKARGGRTKAERSAYMRELAQKSHAARRANAAKVLDTAPK